MKDVKCEGCGHTSKVGNRRKKDIACGVCGNPIKMKKSQVKKLASKKTVKKADTKTTKAVKILKAVFNGLKGVVKWSSENLTVGMVVKGGLIAMIIMALIQGQIDRAISYIFRG